MIMRLDRTNKSCRFMIVLYILFINLYLGPYVYCVFVHFIAVRVSTVILLE